MTPESAILDQLAERDADATICPSEAARRLVGDGGDWRARMGDVHAAVRRLVDRGEVALSWQGARKLVPEGPYRIGRAEAQP